MSNAAEAAHERHNRIAEQLAISIWAGVKETEDRMLVMESTCAAVIGMMTKHLPLGQRSEARQAMASVLSVGIKERLESQS